MPGAARAAHIREWLDKRKAHRKAFSLKEATWIASRVDDAIEELKTGAGGRAVSRNRLALDAFAEGDRGTDAERARRKLQRYVWTQARRTGVGPTRQDFPARAADGYARLVRTLNRHHDRQPDDDRLFIEVFDSTSADPLASSPPIEGEFAALLESRIRALANRLAAHLQLDRYYRDVARFGALRDLGHPQVRFRRDSRHNDPSADVIEAALPHLNPKWFEAGRAMGGPPVVLAGRLPAVVLYRLRGAGPCSVEVQLHKQHVSTNGVLDAIETRKGQISFCWEVAIGAGPSDEWASGTRLFFETVPCPVIELLPDGQSTVASQEEAIETLRPVERYDPETLDHPPVRVYRGDRIVKLWLIDPETGKDAFAITDILWHKFWNKRWFLDPEYACYEPVTAASWYRYLVTLPVEAEHTEDEPAGAIVYGAARPGGQTMGVSPPDTIGAKLEEELLPGTTDEDAGLEAQLRAKGEQLWIALNELRRDSLALDTEAASPTKQATPNEAAEHADEQLRLDIRTWRKQLRLSQREAADWLGVTERTVNEHERGAKALSHRTRLAMLFCLFHPDEALALSQRRRGHDTGDA